MTTTSGQSGDPSADTGWARLRAERNYASRGPTGRLWQRLGSLRNYAPVILAFLPFLLPAMLAVLAYPDLSRWPVLRFSCAVLFCIALMVYLIYQHLRLRRLGLRLDEGEELFRLISENAADMIAVVDVNGHRLYNSPAYQNVLGYSSAELRITSSFQQIHPDDQERVMAAAEEARRTGIGKKMEYRIRHKDGHWLVVESSASAVRDERGEVQKLIIINRDITERKQAEERLEHAALHDALTDLPNRTLFRDRLQRAFERSQINSNYRFAVLFVDIDGFKAFNDSMGHSIGDKIIIEISRRLANCLRYEDALFRPRENDGRHSPADEVLARLGGDEFTVLLGSVQDPSDAMRVARRIQEALGTFSVGGCNIFISASIGIALSSTPHVWAEELLRDADIAMYRAKTLGKSRCEFFDPEMHTKAVQQLELETELRRAVKEEEFRVHYQPIVALESGKIVGFETLVRWQRSRDCLVFPDHFIGAAEGTGLILPMGRWVMRQACRQAQVWQAHYPQDQPLSVSVNLSPKQFADPQLLSDIEDILRDTGIAPGRLQLEITESVTMADPAKTGEILARMKNLGIQICLDDFGTGHSSLSRLQRYPVDILKIDRSFVAHMDTDSSAQAIVRLIIDFAHKVNLRVIAEGIETAAHVDHLKNAHCEFGQGYFFSRAVDAEAVDRLLAADHGAIAGAPDRAKGRGAGAP